VRLCQQRLAPGTLPIAQGWEDDAGIGVGYRAGWALFPNFGRLISPAQLVLIVFITGFGHP
jgi:hypothetical protein